MSETKTKEQLVAAAIQSALHVHEEEVGEREVTIDETRVSGNSVEISGEIDGARFEGLVTVDWIEDE